MKLILYTLASLLVLSVGCSHTGAKKQTKKMNGEKVKSLSPSDKTLSLDDYVGHWEVKKKTYGCSPIKIEKGSKKDTIKITRKSTVGTVSKESSFKIPPQSTVSDYDKYKLSGSAIYKFIRGKIVSAHIWAPDTNDWLGVGVRTWSLDKGKGVLIKKKAGLTMQSNKHLSPKEKMESIFQLNEGDTLGKWEVECEYIKSSKK